TNAKAGDLDNVDVFPLERNLRIVVGMFVLATVVPAEVSVLIGRAAVGLNGICHGSKPFEDPELQWATAAWSGDCGRTSRARGRRNRWEREYRGARSRSE